MRLINNHLISRNCRDGFTLIELLVVIFIISIVAGVALLTVGQNKASKMQAFVKQLTETVTLAQQQAMLEPVVIGIHFTKHQICFYDLKSVAVHREWQPRQDRLFNCLNIPELIQVKLDQTQEVDDKADIKKINPQVVISTNGDLTPFTLYIGWHEEKPRFTIHGDVDGTITQQNIF